jgi:benzoate/toluate 1,2-dioxygenase alpha subunit
VASPAASIWLQGYSRGTTASKPGGNPFSDLICMEPARNVLADAAWR